MMYFLVLIFIAMMNPPVAHSAQAPLKSTVVAIPGGEGGIGFDDWVYSPELHKVLVPAGHTGKLYLIDPATLEMSSIGGFSSSAAFQKGHHTGVSSVDEGEGFIFTADHGTQTLDAIDEKSGKIVAQAPLADDPDIVRYVGINHEIWVTEPDGKDKKQIQIFMFRKYYADPSNPRLQSLPPLQSTTFITVPDGPESLTIDLAHHRAYTNLGEQTAVIDLHSHAIVAQWPNGCEKPRGTAVDKARNFLFVACGEGKAIAFDLNQNGRQVGKVVTGPGADLVDYNPSLAHFYITGSKNATLSVVGVSANGALSLLGISQAVTRSHCVISDDHDNIWVCDPPHGQLLRYKDTFPKSH